MRAGADASIVMTAPIEEVVARLGAGPRVVRDFVGRQSGSLAQLLRDGIKLAGKLALRNTQRACGMARRKRRALLDGQLIEREVIGDMIERVVKLPAPLARGLPLARIDEVEGDAVEIAFGERERS